jgi:hypothetical protein
MADATPAQTPKQNPTNAPPAATATPSPAPSNDSQPGFFSMQTLKSYGIPAAVGAVAGTVVFGVPVLAGAAIAAGATAISRRLRR